MHKRNWRTRTLGFLEWWIFFPMKLSSHCNSLCHNRQRVGYFLLIINQHVNGCYTFCLFCVNDLNQKLPGLTFINKLLIVISMLFALNVTYRVLISGLHRVLTRYWGVVVFGGFFAVLRYLANFFTVLRCSEPPNVPLIDENTAVRRLTPFCTLSFLVSGTSWCIPLLRLAFNLSHLSPFYLGFGGYSLKRSGATLSFSSVES